MESLLVVDDEKNYTAVLSAVLEEEGFEALTAKDRPYKEAMTLSQSLSILENFRNNGHIDPDLYDVFIKMGVYRRYGEAFLDPRQLDC